jgi:hypothetical protein
MLPVRTTSAPADQGSASEVLGPRASLSTTEIESASAAARAISRARRFWAPSTSAGVDTIRRRHAGISRRAVIPYLYGGT